MRITNDNHLKKLILIGDRVFIKPTRPDEKTPIGLYLPTGLQEKEKVQQGYIIKAWPGYVILIQAKWKAVLKEFFGERRRRLVILDLILNMK